MSELHNGRKIRFAQLNCESLTRFPWYIWALIYLMIKRGILLIIGVVVLTAVNAQQKTNDDPKWIESMLDPEANFFETQRLFYDYWSDKTPGKGDGYKPFKRWEWFYEQEISPEGDIPNYNKIMQSVAVFKTNAKAKDADSKSDTLWTPVGPISLPVASSGQPNGMGRVNALGMHPTNDSILFIGAPNGGIWRTYDFGNTWESNTDTFATMQVSSINFNPKNPLIVYAGTGDRDVTSRTHRGVIKSIDGGISWNISNSGMGNVVVGKMIVDPAHPDTILAATSGGIYKSTNGAVSWTRKGSGSGYKDIEAAPNDFSKLYAASGGTMWHSHDGGENWSRSTGIMSGSRGAIAVSADKPNYVYFIQTSNRIFSGLCRSTDYGKTFTTRSTTPNIMDYDINGNGNGGQAWYNLDITANPNNAEEIFVGGINIFKSTNGGSTWTNAAHWLGAVHADQHVLEFSHSGNYMVVGNDGGVYYTPNRGSSWRNISSGLPISEIYKLGQNKYNENEVICGYQDNGTAIYRGNNSWTTEIGGDGMECAFDPVNPLYVYGELYYGAIRRSSNGGRNFGSITNSITEQGAWVSPFILGEADPRYMFAGYVNVYRTTNVRGGNVQWRNITGNINGAPNSTYRVLEQSPANPNILYILRSDGSLYRSDNCKAATPTWTNLSGSKPSGISPTDMEAHPTRKDVIYITGGSKVFVSTDKGASWSDISLNLPNSTKRTIVYDEFSPGGLYVGGTPGVYYIDSTLSNWVDYSQSLPGDVSVTELEIAYNQNAPAKSKIRASTYGRGLWSAPMFNVENRFAKAEISRNKGNFCIGDTISFSSSLSKNGSSFAWNILPNTFQYVNNSSANSKDVSIVLLAAGHYHASLVVSNFFGKDTTEIRNLVFAGPQLLANCLTTTSATGRTSSGVFKVKAGNQEFNAFGYNGISSNTNSSCGELFVFEPDSTYAFTVQVGGSAAEFTQVYIDYNNDGDFTDAGERVYSGAALVGQHSFNYTAPSGPLLNQKLLMRVVSDRQNLTSACATLTHGESRDYGVLFEKPVTTILTSSKVVCPNEVIQLSHNTFGKINSVKWDFGSGASPRYSESFYDQETSYKWGGQKVISYTINDKYVFYDTVLVRFSPYSNLVVDTLKSNLCEGGNAVLQLIDSSGAANAKYTWYRNNSFLQVQGDTLFDQKIFNRFNTLDFFIVVRDSFCTDTSDILYLTPKEKPVAQMAGFLAIQCLRNNSFPFNDNTVMTTSGFTRLWNYGDGATSTQEQTTHSYNDSGIYKVKLSINGNNGCNDSISAQVKINPTPVSGFKATVLNNLDVSFAPVDTSWLNYAWDFGDGNSSSSKNPIHSYGSAGLYSAELKVTSDLSCVSKTGEELTVESPSSSQESFGLRNTVIYPNPSKGVFYIQLSGSEDYFITVFDIMGAEIIHEQYSTKEGKEFSFELFRSGVYLVKIQSGTNSALKQVVVD